MLNVYIVAYCCWERESIIRDPEGGLDSRVISDFSVGSHSHRVIKTIDNCTKTNIRITSKRNIAIDSGIGCDMGRLGDGMLKFVDVYNISMAIDRLQIGDIICQSRAMSVKFKSTLPKHSSEISLGEDTSFFDCSPSKSQIVHLYLYINRIQQNEYRVCRIDF